MRMAKKFAKSVEVKYDDDGTQEIVATIKESTFQVLSEAAGDNTNAVDINEILYGLYMLPNQDWSRYEDKVSIKKTN